MSRHAGRVAMFLTLAVIGLLLAMASQAQDDRPAVPTEIRCCNG